MKLYSGMSVSSTKCPYINHPQSLWGQSIIILVSQIRNRIWEVQQLGPRLQYFTVVPMGLVLSDWGHLAMSGDIFHCHNQAGANLDSEEKPRKLLNILQGKEQPPTREDDPHPQHDHRTVAENCGTAAVSNAPVTALRAAAFRTAVVDSCGQGCATIPLSRHLWECGLASLFGGFGTLGGS